MKTIYASISVMYWILNISFVNGQGFDYAKLNLKIEPVSYIVFGPYYRGSLSYISMGYNLKFKSSANNIDLKLMSDELEIGFRFNPNLSNKIMRTIDHSAIDIYTTFGFYAQTSLLEIKNNPISSFQYECAYLKAGLDYSRWSGINNLATGERGVDGIGILSIAVGTQFKLANKISTFVQFENSLIAGYINSKNRGVIYKGKKQSYDRFWSFTLGINLPFSILLNTADMNTTAIVQQKLITPDEYSLSFDSKMPPNVEISFKNNSSIENGKGSIKISSDKKLSLEIIEKPGPTVLIVDMSYFNSETGASQKIYNIIKRRVDNKNVLLLISNGDEAFKAYSKDRSEMEIVLGKITSLLPKNPHLYDVLDKVTEKYKTDLFEALKINGSSLIIISSLRALEDDVLSENAKDDFVHRLKSWGFTKIPFENISFLVPGEVLEAGQINLINRYGLNVISE